jgi:hypothetical protein
VEHLYYINFHRNEKYRYVKLTIISSALLNFSSSIADEEKTEEDAVTEMISW